MGDFTNPLALTVSVQHLRGERLATYTVPLPGSLPIDTIEHDRLLEVLKEAGAYAYCRLADEALWTPPGWRRVEETT